MKRREFLKLGLSLPLLSLVTSQSLYAKDFSDYKAIVILELDGGNDAFNTFVSIDDNSYNSYKDIRKVIAINNTDLGSGSDDLSGGNPYDADSLEEAYKKGVYSISDGDKKFGINGMMPEFAKLFNDGVISIVSKVGTLVEPTTKAQIENKSAKLPLFLFAHDHQRRAIYTAKAQDIIKTGFAGRVADSWGSMNGDIGLVISYAGMNQVAIGDTSSPFILRDEPNYYKDDFGDFLNSISIDTQNPFSSIYQRLQKKSVGLSSTLQDAWDNVGDFSSTNSYGQTIFTLPDPNDDLKLDIHSLDTKLFRSFGNIAKMIKIAKNNLSYNRQIFVIKMGGFDFHSAQTKDQTIKLRSLSLALSDFYKALGEIDAQKEVAVVALSDFGRTMLPNDDGTDHGWGGHSFVMCGSDSFNGGKIFGDMINDFSLSGDEVYPERREKGRLIPTTSIEQFVAPVFDWFGASESEIALAFPNLANFRSDSGDYKSAFLQGVFS